MYLPSQFPKEKPQPSLFNRLEREVAERERKEGKRIFALHVGDTFLNVPTPMMTPQVDEEIRYGSMLNRYGDTFGDLPLRELLLAKVQQKNHLPVESVDSIQITAGATGALQACFSRLFDPGDTLMVLSPYWTILRQVAGQAKIQMLEIPLFDRLAEDEDLNLAELLEEYGDPWCKGIYLNTPSNPTGMVLKEKHLQQIADFAKHRNLWVFSDEAYEDFIYDDNQHLSIGSLPGMIDRTLSIYTCSKNFGTSGLRVGYLAGTPPVVAELNRAVVGGYYHAGRFDQLMAWRGFNNYQECFQPLLDHYRKNWQWARENIKAEFLPVSGSFYFFVRLGEDWIGLSTGQKVNRMLEAGLVLSPGESFGTEYEGWARMCFTIIPEDDLQEAVVRLNRMLGK